MNRNQLWFISVGAGRWQTAGICAAQDAGLKVLALDGDPDAPGLNVSDRSLIVDIADPDAVVKAVSDSGVSASGAASFATEVGMRAVGALRDQLGLPGPGAGVLERLTDKSVQRQAWHDAGLANPNFWRAADSVDACLEAIGAADEPVLVKPVDSAGSRGITHLPTNAGPELCEHAARNALSRSRTGRVIVESVLPGREYTVETFANDGVTHVLTVTVKRKVAHTADTVADELATPDDGPETLSVIADLACRALEYVGYDEGPGHVEVMFAPETGPALIEAAGRGAGFLVFERYVPLLSGFDILTATARQAVGLPVDVIQTGRGAGLIRFFPSRPGRVRSFTGFDEANACPGVEAGPFVKVGDRTSEATSDGDRLGYILATADTPPGARRLADQAERLITFEIDSRG